MYPSTAHTMDLNSVLAKVVPVAQMIMFGAMKAGGVQFPSNMKESGAATKYLANSQNIYMNNVVVQGIIRSLKSRRKGKKPDLKTLDTNQIMRMVDEINPILDAAPLQQGVGVKNFLYGLAEAVVNASGSGFLGGGERVTEGETKYLADLKGHLRISEPVESEGAQQTPQAQQAAPSPQATPPVAPPSAGEMDVTAQLQKLAELKQAGVLTDEEFAAAKKKLLSG